MSDVATSRPGSSIRNSAPPQETLSRRSVVAGAAGLTVLVGAAGASALTVATSKPAGSAPNLWDRQYWTLESAGVQEWLRNVGSNFTIVADNGRNVTMRLSAVLPFPNRGSRPAQLGRASAFDTLFDPADRNAVKGNRIYRVRHARYGDMNIFLTRTPKGRLEAVFN
ncbi:DUF6916 family protein [Sphingosinicella sp. LY1275]|uniref:DUF6916 family protein n=1 Tax=Sphingosinicella sp. LY1275 TaxID=3095379 RepID=UPI002ADEE3CB|nr:hypothetical protein [Sphingosinicella sp. LY1275]MEA1016054.1 hypothetical protein [Sphingosinicella sp. LY1275]